MRIALLLIEGFAAKIITGADDTATHAPVMGSLINTKNERLGFLGGMLASILVIIVVAILFADILLLIPHKNIIAAMLLLLLAILVQFNVFIHKPREKCCKYLEKQPSHVRFFRALGLGFLTFFATAVDDVVAYSSILLKAFNEQMIVAVGIIIAALIELFIVFKFSQQIAKIKYKSEITVVGLFILALLVAFGII